MGLFAWWRRPDNPTGLLMVVTAFAWYISILERIDAPLLFSIGILLREPVRRDGVHLVLAFPEGRLRSRFDRWLVGAGYAIVTLGFLPVVLFAGGDVYGCASCPHNEFAVASAPDFAETWLDGLAWVGVGFSVVVIVRLVQHWRRASPPLRRTVTPVYLAGGLLELLLGIVLLLSVINVGSMGLHNALFYSALVPFGLVPFLFLAVLVKGKVLRGSGLGDLMHRLGPGVGRGELRAALADSLATRPWRSPTGCPTPSSTSTPTGGR